MNFGWNLPVVDRATVASVGALVVSVLTITSMFVGSVGFADGATTTQDGVAATDLEQESSAVSASSAALQTPGGRTTGTDKRSLRSDTDQAAISPVSSNSEDFTSETFLSTVTQPMGVTFLPDGRMLVIEKPGTVRITDPSDGTKDTTKYLDITDQVYDGGEHGLIDITLDPNFEQNGYVYLFYSNDAESKNRIARFTHQENGGDLRSVADPSSEFVVWKENEQWPDTCCHQGAGLDFGPKGKLWLTTGDDFTGGEASQDPTKSDGKVIRVNKDGTIPDDNPYANDGNASTLGEIWSSGLRNPFRAEWDLGSDPARFFIGDVGGNNAPDYEEVNLATLGDAGTNYGWPRCENTSRSNTVNGEEVPCDINQTPPIYAYDKSVGNSITGGEVYRENSFPEKYQGSYFFGDYGEDFIKYMTFNSNGNVENVATFEDNAVNVNSITVGPDGALYWTNINDGVDSGEVEKGAVYKISFTGDEAPSIESVSATPTSASTAPKTVDFDVSASDPDDDSLTYEWTFGDGSTGPGASPSHTYQEAGVYTAYVEVSDDTQTIQSELIEITIGESPTVTIDSPSAGMLFRAGEEISFSVSASDPQDGQLSGASVSWDVNFDHDPPEGAAHTHPTVTNDTGASGSFDVPTSGHDYRTDTSYTLTVTATDSDGLSASKSVTIEPDKVGVTFNTDPGGLDYSIDGIPQTGPVTYDTLIDFQHEVKAPPTQCLDGSEYEFTGWSDGGARGHTYTVPDSDATLTANYEKIGECSGPPSDGLVAQYEASEGLSTSNGQVTGWADQSGRGNDLTAGGDPTIATAPSGQPAVSFDGSGDKLERTGSLNGFPSGNGDRMVVLVTKYESAGYGGFAFGNDNGNEAFGTIVDPNGDLMVQAWGVSNDFSSGVAGTGEGWLIQSATVDSDSLEHYKDGQLIDTSSHSYNTDLQQLVMGAEIDSSPYLDMEVAAAYIYNRSLSNTERQQVESHLQNKYLDEGGTTNKPPTADFHYHDPVAGESATYHSESVDSDGQITKYEWDFDGDGTFEESTTDEEINHTFESAGDYDVTLRVTDDDGAIDTITKTVTVSNGESNQAPSANDDSATIDAGGSTNIDVLDNDEDPDGSLDTSSVSIVSQPSSGSVTLDSSTAEIIYSAPANASGEVTFGYTVDDDDGATSNEATVTVETDSGGTTDGEVVHRVNVGGPELTSTDPSWSADNDSSASPYLVSENGLSFTDNGGAVDQKASIVPNGTPLEMFNSARYVDTDNTAEMNWEFSTEAGTTYEVRLHFAEPYFGGSGPGNEGARQFHVDIEGDRKLDNYDIYADVGFGTGTTKTFTVTSDGTLDVDLVDGAANNPIVNGIEIVEVSDDDGNTPPTIGPISDQTVTEGDSTTVPVTASDDDGDSVSLSLGQSPDFVSLSNGELTIAPQSGDAANSPYTVEVVADDDTDQSNETFQVTVQSGTPEASFAVNPGGDVNASTWDNDAYQIENTGDVNIESVNIDTSTAILPDLVFDPQGTAGDGGDKSFQQGSSSDDVGLGSTDDADIFSAPHNDAGGDDGYEQMTLTFDDFQSGESLQFGSDGDPTSIKGAENNVQNSLAGPVSGAELAGATVTVEFADGTTKTVQTFGDGSAGGSEVVTSADQSTPPTLGLEDGSLNDSALDARHSAATVSDTEQTLTVSGPENVVVQVMQANTELNLEAVPTYDGTPGYNVEPYEGNNFVDVTYHTVSLGSDGTATVDVTVPDVDDQQAYFMAIENDDGSTSEPLNVVVLEHDSSAGGPDPVGDFENAPTDPDDDGLYEDVNGDGSVNVGDAQALFANTDDPVVQNNVDAFDYNDDGSVNVGDAQALFANGEGA